MNASQQVLLDRLLAFQIDEPDAKLTFAKRLARENGWSVAYAERVIVEYKKFLYLAMAVGHVVSPSEQVDQAWHLHLTYTRSYWNDLCKDLLGKPLHHGPTKGGDEEQAKFIDLYNQTLASYRRLIGEEPPADIWSPAEQRFGEDLHHVSVNTERYWIIPKPHWPRLPKGMATMPLFAVGLVSLPLAVSAWNPLDWRGPQFLVFYVVLMLLAAILALATKLVVPAEENLLSDEKARLLDPYEAACLGAGPARAVQAAFAAMVQAGTLVLATEKKGWGLFSWNTTEIRQGKPVTTSAPPLEQALFHAAALPASGIGPLVAAGMPLAKGIEEDLARRGFLQIGPPSARSVAAGFVMAAPLLVGLPKIAVGLWRERPVAFLIALCVVTFAAAIAFLVARRRLTRSGQDLLESLQARHPEAAYTESAAATFSPAQLAMGVGLFGAGWLAAGPLANVHALLPRQSGGGGCSASNGGCSSGGCGGGGGGCGGGGCGGGGCGGCGGG